MLLVKLMLIKLCSMKLQIFFLLITIVMMSCIKDDFLDDGVEPELRITATIDSLAIDSIFQSKLIYLNNVGKVQQVLARWESSDLEVASVHETTGLIQAKGAGSCQISASYTEGGVLNRMLFL